MPLNTPSTAQEVENRAKVDVQNQLPDANPFLPNSWLSTLISAYSNRIFDFYQNLDAAVSESFYDTSTGDFLDRQADWFKVTRLTATQATGNAVFTGVNTTVIADATQITTSDGLIFQTVGASVIASDLIAITQITRTLQVATVNTTVNHEFASGISVTIADANEIEYNGTFEISVIDDDTFTYILVGTPSTPATGIITASSASAFVPIVSQDFSESTNLEGSTLLTLVSPITGIDNTVTLDINGTIGGSDLETDENFRDRFLFTTQNPTAHFNVSDITKIILDNVAGVTRVFVQEVTPANGQVTIYFMRDNDTDPIPDAGEVATVKTEVLTIKPANTSDTDVIVVAPTGETVVFDFSALDPNTPTMLQSITDNLQFYFSTATLINVPITANAYNSVIFSTVDSTNGDRVQDFTLSLPAGDVAIGVGEIGILGAVTG